MRRRLRLLLLLGLVAGCQPSRPTQDPLDYLAAGVEPGEEADRVALALGRAGFVVDQRVEGGGAVALAARRRRDGATAVRVITRRGVVLGLDAPDARQPDRVAVRLPEQARFSRREMDGHVELPVEVITDIQCVAVIVVDAGGFVSELSRDENPHPNEGCYPEEPDDSEDAELELEEGDEIIDEVSPGSPGAPSED
jgi:hypothetical protein